MTSSWFRSIEKYPRSTGQVEAWLLGLAAAFLFLFSLILSLSPAARLRSWETTFLWTHWVGYLVWLAGFWIVHVQLNRRLPDRDPFLLPIAATLVGWGILTIWRVSPAFGARQTVWLALAVLLSVVVLRLPEELTVLRRYKYLWLTGGLILTALTFVLGTNPTGFGPRLWLGCCGVYFQPSEALKLLLVIYLAAYLADRQFLTPRLLPLLAPTLLIIGITIGLMLVQRDLGTATIFLILFISVVYFATGKNRFLLIGGAILLLAGLAGTLLYDVIRIRVDAWINPWLDPSGRSYQIVQSLLAVASGGMLGRGPGMGSPEFVPVQHSDFIFASIAEETGLAGTLVLLLLIAGLTVRGLRAALSAPDRFRRYLAVGLTVYISAQSILIIGGNLRLLPLTGVTLPFVSYGGSSLFTSTLALLFLIIISGARSDEPAQFFSPQPIQVIGALLLSGIGALALVNGWWAFYRGPDLLTRTDNPRRAQSDLYVERGSILDRGDYPLADSEGRPGEYLRRYLVPALGPVLGYVHPLYGQAGIEDAQDGYLRGLQGIEPVEVWWNHLLYGQPPPGVDVRQTLDLEIQQYADDLLEGRNGAAVLMNSESGEILVMASHPYFDPNRLDEEWPALIERQDAPLLNRASLGQYPPGAALGPVLLAAALDAGALPEVPGGGGDLTLDGCTFPPEEVTWQDVIERGCPAGTVELSRILGAGGAQDIFTRLGFYESPQLLIPAASTPLQPGEGDLASLLVSPLQMAMAVSTLNGGGVLPAPRIATAFRGQDGTWNSLAPAATAREVFSTQSASAASELLSVNDRPYWETIAVTETADGQSLTWYLAGTEATWQGAPLSLVLILEEENPAAAGQIGRSLFDYSLE
ncbi:MAG TPA: FtsW/RodA/SpoVE family cell cycle protein [Anaerolineales bacterium]|nr:FtsW/RodA/SpoVE family cell cycle protein [Anaerolineales bacterium]